MTTGLASVIAGLALVISGLDSLISRLVSVTKVSVSVISCPLSTDVDISPVASFDCAAPKVGCDTVSINSNEARLSRLEANGESVCVADTAVSVGSVEQADIAKEVSISAVTNLVWVKVRMDDRIVQLNMTTRY